MKVMIFQYDDLKPISRTGFGLILLNLGCLGCLQNGKPSARRLACGFGFGFCFGFGSNVVGREQQQRERREHDVFWRLYASSSDADAKVDHADDDDEAKSDIIGSSGRGDGDNDDDEVDVICDDCGEYDDVFCGCVVLNLQLYLQSCVWGSG